jgi:hypothetical protein
MKSRKWWPIKRDARIYQGMLLEEVNFDFALNFDCFPELTQKAFQECWYKAPSLDTLSHIILIILLRGD